MQSFELFSYIVAGVQTYGLVGSGWLFLPLLLGTLSTNELCLDFARELLPFDSSNCLLALGCRSVHCLIHVDHGLGLGLVFARMSASVLFCCILGWLVLVTM